MKNVKRIFAMIALLFMFAGCGKASGTGMQEITVSIDAASAKIKSLKRDAKVIVNGNFPSDAYILRDISDALHNSDIKIYLDLSAVQGLSEIRDEFLGCISLIGITLPDSLTAIKGESLTACSALEDINIGSENSDFISQDGILYSKDMTEIVRYPNGKTETFFSIPEGVTKIGEGAFAYNHILTTIEIPESVTEIGSEAFAYSDLTSIEIPDNVTTIGSGAFRQCSELSSIELPYYLTAIEDEVFSVCSALSSIEIPYSVTSIGNGAFEFCGVLTSIEIPDDVISIGDNAFYGCKSLSDVEMNYGTTSIGDKAFYQCKSLNVIRLPDTVESIGEEAFAECYAYILVPDRATNIGKNAFAKNNGITLSLTNGTFSNYEPIHSSVDKKYGTMVKILGKNIKMLSTEVTQRLYQWVMDENPSNNKGENNPVENVSWYDAIYFCNKLSMKAGLKPAYSVNGTADVTKWRYTPNRGNTLRGEVSQVWGANGFRLPESGEWEYAAQGGQNVIYSGSDNIDDVAWYEGNSGYRTHPVAQKKANGYGLFDMSGNVMELVGEPHNSYNGSEADYYGGGYRSYADECQLNSYELGYDSVSVNRQYDGIGFRIVCSD